MKWIKNKIKTPEGEISEGNSETNNLARIDKVDGEQDEDNKTPEGDNSSEDSEMKILATTEVVEEEKVED